MSLTRNCLLALSVVACLTAPAFAQPRPKGEPVKTSGTIKGGSRGILLVTSDQGDQFRVKAPTRTDYVKFIGSAHPSWLKRGMFVAFVGKFDKKGNAVARVSEMEVFTPSKETKIGAIRDSGLGGSAKNLFSSDDEPKKPVPEGVTLKITGRVVAAKSGKLTVQAGRTSFKVQLSDNANISVDVKGLQFLRAGDKVSIEGQYLPQQRRDIVATRLTISAAEKLGAPRTAPKKDN